MNQRRRRSLRDRDEFAIDTPQVAEPDVAEQPPAAPAAQPAPEVAAEPPAPSPSARSSAASRPAGADARSSTERIGIYFRSPQAFDDAKSAYLSDWEELSDSADTFARWIAEVLRRHARRSPQERASIADQAATQLTGDRSTRTFMIPEDARAAASAAVAADGRAGRWVSLSQFAGDAIAAAVDEARSRTGGALPPAPARLPNRLHR